MTDLWYHDGTGFGWPAIATRRSETTEEAYEEVIAPVGVEVSPGVVEQEMQPVQVPLGHTITRVTRDLVVFYTGAEEIAGLKPTETGTCRVLDVPEGSPSEAGTCSHIQWQPGTEMHARMVMNGIEETGGALREHVEQLRLEILRTEQAIQANDALGAQRREEHRLA